MATEQKSATATTLMGGSEIPIPTTNHPTFKRRLSLFTFGSKPDTLSSASNSKVFGSLSGAAAAAANADAANAAPSTSPTNQLMSPVISPEHPQPFPFVESDIFERSLDTSGAHVVPKCSRCATTRSRLCTHNSSISIQGGQFLKQEDCIPAALDATASILHDDETSLDEVEMVYSNRRSSSVIGLNMALGRTFTPSRKNSMFSISGAANQQLQSQALSQPLTHFQNLQNYQSTNLNPQLNSPPKLNHSKSSVNFCSYADLLNNDEFAKRPSVSQRSQSQYSITSLQSLQDAASASPTNGHTLGQRFSRSGLERSNSNASTQFSQLSKQILKQQASNTANGPSLNKKFLISPESSDNEEIEPLSKDALGRHMSIGSHRSNVSLGLLDAFDTESVISTSMGDCLRRTQTELNAN